MAKKKKMEEALASGQINVTESLFRRKRRRVDESSTNGGNYGRVHNSANDKSRGGARARGTDNGWRGRGGGRAVVHRTSNVGDYRLVSPSAVKSCPTRASSPSCSGSDDEIPEVASSKPPICSVDSEFSASHEDSGHPKGVGTRDVEHTGDIPGQSVNLPSRQPVKSLKKVYSTHPKKPPHNPFATRPILLRNVRQTPISH
jgi:hypothetical protein